jgi:hypothetical protein
MFHVERVEGHRDTMSISAFDPESQRSAESTARSTAEVSLSKPAAVPNFNPF